MRASQSELGVDVDNVYCFNGGARVRVICIYAISKHDFLFVSLA